MKQGLPQVGQLVILVKILKNAKLVSCKVHHPSLMIYSGLFLGSTLTFLFTISAHVIALVTVGPVPVRIIFSSFCTNKIDKTILRKTRNKTCRKQLQARNKKRESSQRKTTRSGILEIYSTLSSLSACEMTFLILLPPFTWMSHFCFSSSSASLLPLVKCSMRLLLLRDIRNIDPSRQTVQLDAILEVALTTAITLYQVSGSREWTGSYFIYGNYYVPCGTLL